MPGWLSRSGAWKAHLWSPCIQGSATVVVGAHDLPGIRQRCEQITEAMPAATLAVIDGSAHCPPLDQPEQLNSLVLDFLGPMGG